MSKFMAKEPGLNNFKTLGPKPTDVNALAEQYANTESSLRESIKQSLDEGRDVSKLERDLSAFYSSICNKFGIDIKSHDDFLEFIESLRDYQTIMDDAKSKVENSDDKNLLITTKDAEPNFGNDADAKSKWNLSEDFKILSNSDKNKKWIPKTDKWRDDVAPTSHSKAPDATLGESRRKLSDDISSNSNSNVPDAAREKDDRKKISDKDKTTENSREEGQSYNLYKDYAKSGKSAKSDISNDRSRQKRNYDESQNYDDELDNDDQ